MKTLDEIKYIVSLCKYKDWDFLTYLDYEKRPILQIRVASSCSVSGQPWVWKGRKWFLSFHMCDNEIVGTVFVAVKKAEEHEIREFFTFKSAAIYGPHFNVDQLVKLCQQPDALDGRKVA